MDADMSPEMAAQVLSMLTGGASMDHINTSLALRLIPLAQELEDDELVERLLDHASSVAASDEERGWARFEALKIVEDEAKIKIKRKYLKQNRVGDHIWYISNMKKFKNDYPKWRQKFSTKKILVQLIDEFS